MEALPPDPRPSRSGTWLRCPTRRAADRRSGRPTPPCRRTRRPARRRPGRPGRRPAGPRRRSPTSGRPRAATRRRPPTCRRTAWPRRRRGRTRRRRRRPPARPSRSRRAPRRRSPSGPATTFTAVTVPDAEKLASCCSATATVPSEVTTWDIGPEVTSTTWLSAAAEEEESPAVVFQAHQPPRATSGHERHDDPRARGQGSEDLLHLAAPISSCRWRRRRRRRSEGRPCHRSRRARPCGSRWRRRWCRRPHR